MTKPKPKHKHKKRGPKPPPIDLALVERLASRQGSYREIAACLGMLESTFRARAKQDPRIQEAIDNGSAKGCMTLRTRMWNSAMEGVPSIQIFMGKNHLGMRDHHETQVTGTIAHTGAYDLTKLSTPELEAFQTLLKKTTAEKPDAGEDEAA
jgi:hypothetical protein